MCGNKDLYFETLMAASLLGLANCDFVDSVPEDYYCKKCSLVARRLTVTSCCEGHFCYSCIADSQQQDKSCPECGEFFNFFELVKHQKRITSLKVYCSLKGRGCDWSGTLEELEAHLDPDQDNCQYVDTKCPLNCQQAIPKNKVEQHVREECVKREHVCQHCNFKATYEEVVDTHLPECMYVPLKCPNFCGVTCEREVMEDHMKMCRLETIDCGFMDMGCGETFHREDEEEHARQFSHNHLSQLAGTVMKIQEEKVSQNEKLEQEEKVDQKLQQQKQLILEQNIKHVDLEQKLLEQEQKRVDQKLALEAKFEKAMKDQQQSFAAKLEKLEKSLQEPILLLNKHRKELKEVVAKTVTKVYNDEALY